MKYENVLSVFHNYGLIDSNLQKRPEQAEHLCPSYIPSILLIGQPFASMQIKPLRTFSQDDVISGPYLDDDAQ